MLDVRRLRLLREVARHGSLAGAADALSFTQPAVSKQIAQLEREAGIPLVHRTSRGVRLTDAGRLLVDHADEILARLAAAEAALQDLAGLRAGTVRLGAFPSAFSALVPTALRAFRRHAPAVGVDVDVRDPEDALRCVRRGDLDLAVVYDHRFARLSIPPGIVRHDLFDDPLLAALARDHPLARRAALALSELADERWIQGAGGPTAQLVHHACLAAGFTPRIAAETGDATAAQGLVAAGVGVTLLPALGLSTARADIVVRPIVDSAPTRAIALIAGAADQPPAVIALRRILEQASSSGQRDHRELGDAVEVAPVARHQRDPMGQRGRGDERVGRGDAGFPPRDSGELGDRRVDRQLDHRREEAP